MRESACTPPRAIAVRHLTAGGDTKIKWIAIACLLGTVLVTCVGRGLSVPVGDVLGLLALTVPLVLLAGWLSLKNYGDLAFCLVATAEFIAFTCSYTAVTGLVLMTERPLVDDWLMSSDTALGMHLPSLQAWMQHHSVINAVLTLSYHTVVPQTLATIFLLGLSGCRVDVQKFLLRLMIAAFITLVLFAAFPAAGPFTSYGMELGDAQIEYLEYLHEFRQTEQPTPRFFILQGLITFPSFHAAWAVVLIAAHWRSPQWRMAFGLLNAAVLLSTPVVGSHYLTDVVAGVMIGLIAVASTRCCSNEFWGTRT